MANLTSDQRITIHYSDRHGSYSFSPSGVEEALQSITGPVDGGAWAHAVGEARRGGVVTLGELAARITAANDRLVAVLAKKGGSRQVKCDCGHECDSNHVMSASLGSSCPDCYDRMS